MARHGTSKAGFTATALLVGALALSFALAPVAQASKGQTKTATLITTAGATKSVQTRCPARTHLTGGGFALTPAYNPQGTTTTADDTGARGLIQVSHPSGAARKDVGRRTWKATVGRFSAPAGNGTMHVYARCERNSEGQIAFRATQNVTLSPNQGANLTPTCPPTTHVLGGGFSTTNPFNPTDSATSRLIVLESRRGNARTWRVSGYNPNGSAASFDFTAYADCERNSHGKVKAHSSFGNVANFSRASAKAGCKRHTHVISGGFLVSPATFPGTVPLIAVDENRPVGGRAWRIGLYAFPPLAQPAGTSLTAYAYCKKN